MDSQVTIVLILSLASLARRKFRFLNFKLTFKYFWVTPYILLVRNATDSDMVFMFKFHA